ncbi:TetR/AcrR family transcriptional regulator [Litorivivens sp.]|uniref:TetR/AcrR family transcriptional regulator n=1 Tax=Litorivivens sp. TaxID=2020868 RepID=UPI00356783B8
MPMKKATQKRSYNSPLREQQSAETRENIVSAGAALVHTLPDWDWKNLSARAVGEKAGVSERTVRRYFTTDAKLRDAVLKRLVEESGIDLSTLSLSDFSEVVVGLFQHLQSFQAKTTTPQDSAFDSLDRLRRAGLINAVVAETPDWSPEEQETAAAMLDILWQPQLFERLTGRWGFDDERTSRSLRWLFTLMHEAISAGRKP